MLFFQKTLQFAVCIVSFLYAVNRPAAPVLSGVSFDNDIITITASASEGDSCHAVLLTDLSIPLEYAYTFGNHSNPLEGSVISYAVPPSVLPLKLFVGNQSRERYFVAIASSKVNDDGIRSFSGWKVYTDSSGVPIPVSTGYNTKGENLIYRARRINERRPEQVIVDLSFSVPKDSAAKYNLLLRQNATTLLTLPNLSSIPNSASDIRAAVNSVNLIQNNNLVFKREQNGFYLYNVYAFVSNFNNSDELFAVLIKSSGTVTDTNEVQIGVGADSSYQDINSTILTLACMADNTPDPFYPGTISAISDSVKIKLLVSAMVDLSLAHNSPLPSSAEISQGIFTNYMQFMDNIAGNWNSIRSVTRGISRLQAIHNRILEQNKGNIIDPVEIVNHGTSFEPNNQERKNYVYPIGFSRINWEIEKPDYNASLSGTGLMFRISDNIALYRAKTDNLIPVFDTLPFLSGDSGRRFIFRMNDTIINSMVNDSDGVWVRAISDTGSVQFYSGIVPVRLPIKRSGSSSPVKIDTAFSLPNENSKGTGRDPIGTIIKDAEKSLLKLYVLNENKGKTDTLSNVTDPNMILHGQKRRVVVDSTYFFGKRIKFSFQTANVDKNKMYFTDSSKYSLTMVDTSFFVKPWTLLAATIVSWKGKEKVAQTIGQTGHNGKICLRDADNGNQYVWAGKSDTFAVAVETNSSAWVQANNNSYIDVKSVKGSARLYKRKTCSFDDEIVDLIMWNTFKDSVLNRDSIFVVCKNPGESVIELSIGGSDAKNAVRERLVINRVVMKICDTLNRDLSIQANAFSPKRIITRFSSNPYDTARIRLQGLIFPEAQDTVTNVRFEILYDTTNSEHVQFYSGTTGPNRVVMSLNASNAARAENLAVKWDGRDSADNRILLGGRYSAIITATTIKNKVFKVTKQFFMANPPLLSFGINYPLRAEVQHEIDMYLHYDSLDYLNWNAVPFLNNSSYRNFQWLGNFASAIGLAGDINGYNTKVLAGNTHSEAMLDSLNNSSAVFRIMGHHTLSEYSGDTIGKTLFNGERLFAHCIEDFDICTDGYNTHCLNFKCNGSERNARYLDDVLFAALIGCRTGVGNHSTAQALVDQGVDCVLATKLRVPASFMVFFNRFLWIKLNEAGTTIEEAAISAYDDAINKMVEFTNMSDRAALFRAFTNNSTQERYLDVYGNTITFFNNPSLNLLPARYGMHE